MLETLDHTIRIGSTPTFLYFDLYEFIIYFELRSQTRLQLTAYLVTKPHFAVTFRLNIKARFGNNNSLTIKKISKLKFHHNKIIKIFNIVASFCVKYFFGFFHYIFL